MQLRRIVQYLGGRIEGIVFVLRQGLPGPGPPGPHRPIGAQGSTHRVHHRHRHHVLQQPVGLLLPECPAVVGSAPAPEGPLLVNGRCHDEPRVHIPGILQQDIGLLPGQRVLVRGAHRAVEAVAPGQQGAVRPDGIVGVSAGGDGLADGLQRRRCAGQQHRRQQPADDFFHIRRLLFFNCTTPRLQKQAPRLSARGLSLISRSSRTSPPGRRTEGTGNPPAGTPPRTHSRRRCSGSR